ncbi:MAG: phosphatidylserine decarboxylase [Actinomycetota bacterium]|nr:phosphatidylserine decarboxylase [Actinomycetota bacterium]
MLVPLAVGVVLLPTSRRGAVIAFALAGSVLAFFRDPARRLDHDPGLVYAAADGVVTAVEAVPSPWIDEGDSLRIATYLSLRNVHVNRSPIEGTVTVIEERAGGFTPAFLAKAGAKNRQNRICIDGPSGRALVVQVAGILARRISRWVEVGESVEAGQRIGLIHFGSRTDVLVPACAAVPLVGLGDRVRAGVTPLALYHKPARPGLRPVPHKRRGGVA